MSYIAFCGRDCEKCERVGAILANDPDALRNLRK